MRYVILDCYLFLKEKDINIKYSHRNILPILSGLTVVLIWSGWIIISRLGVTTTLTPSDITFLRFSTAAIITLPWSLNYKWGDVRWKAVIIVSLGCGFPYTMLSFYGMQLSNALNVGVLVNGILPITVALFSFIFIKKNIGYKVCVVALGFLISSIFLYLGKSDASELNLFSVLCLLLAGCTLSFYMVFSKYYDVTVKDTLAWVPLINTILFAPIWLASTSKIRDASLVDIFVQVIYQGIIVSVGALLLLAYTIKKLNAVLASMFMAFVPTTTAILGIFFLNEYPSMLQWVGVITCSSFLLFYALNPDKSQ